MRIHPALAIGLLSLLLLCASAPATAGDLLLATTTSTDNTGLLDDLAPMFEKETGITLKWIAVGTGKALELGRNCDADALLVHAPKAEKRYVENGYGVDRTRVMYNDFILIGPPEDPAGMKGMKVTQALSRIEAEGADFASRGDNSGTHKNERKLWQATGDGAPDGDQWYMETGQGMMSTIRVAAEKDAYTMADRGTFIKYADNFDGDPPLKVLVEGDKILFNQYSAMAINPEHCDNVDHESAQAFLDWITSEHVQNAIGEY
ncbi:MAG: substrate-binding domain-containing protein, partial [Desulfohalobiaceae bacterium]